MPQRRLLLLTSLPDLAKSFRADRVHREIARRVARARFGRAFEIVAVPAVPHEELAGLLRSVRPTDLHIRCHGRPDALLLEDRHGREAALTLPELQHLLTPHARRLRFLALEACFSARMAEQLASASRLTVGMTDRINPEHTEAFFAAYYQAIAGGTCPMDAFRDARLYLEIFTPDGARTPRLCTSADGGDGLVAPIFAAHSEDDHDQDDDALGQTPLPGLDLARRDFIAPALRLSGGGSPDEADAPLLDQLDRAARRGGLVLLAGPPGAGRTRTLALWLDRTLARRSDDTGLLFAWSFDLVGQPADPRAFLGALADRVDLPRLACLEGSDHALARALARALRHERFVLVLDGVVAQPGVAAGACVERALHPGLAALLRGLEGATNGACVFTTGAPLELSDLALQVCELQPLTPVEGSACLWRHGLLIPEPDLLRLSEGLRGNRLALSWVARAPRDALTRSPAPNAADPLIEAIDLLKLGDDARHLLTALVLAGGILTGAQLARSWSFLGSGELLDALAALTDVGLIHVERRLLGAPPEPHLRVELTHPRLQELVLRRCAQGTDPLPRLSIGDLLGPEPEPLVDAPRGLPVLQQRLLALIAYGQIADALRLYVTRVACYTHNFEDDAAPEPHPAQLTGVPKQKQWSFIARDLGLHAADLDLLAPFFSRPFSAVHPDLESGTCSRASAVLAFDLAYIHHRAALALRNLGRVRDADPPFAAAYLRYLDLHDLERAATCANDRAELLVMLGDLGRARETADLAVGHAASHLEAQERGAAHVGRAAQRLRQARVTRSLTHATLGHILHLSGDLSAAAEAFARAEAETLAIAKADSKSASPGEIPSSAQYLFSRPGLYHWTFLLGQLEDSARAGAPLPADALNALEARLSAASTWNARPGINKVSVSYSEYARARLCAVRLIVAGADDRTALIDAAELHFARAIDLLHRSHHTWALPELHRARARLRDHAGDPQGAALDRQEADHLAARLDMPARASPSTGSGAQARSR